MSDIHLVPVRAKDLDAVYALLAQRNAQAEPLDAPDAFHADGMERVEVPRNGSWARADLADLYNRCFDRNIAILTKVAEASQAGAEATYKDLLDAGRPLAKDPDHYEYNNLRADLAWIAKFSKRVKDGQHVWPMVVREADETSPKGERYLYRMPAQIAEWWLELAGVTTNATARTEEG